jgi:heat shock protein beta
VFDDEEDENLDPQASAIHAAVAQKTREREYEAFKPLTDWLREVLEEHVIQVTISNRLTKSACALVAQDGGLHGNLERVMRAQALSQGNEHTAYQLDVGFRKILEINTQHPLIRAMAAQVKVTPESAEILRKEKEDKKEEDGNDKDAKKKDKKEKKAPKRFYSGDDFVATPKQELAFLLFETTQLRSDYEIADRSAFASRIEDVMRRALDVDLNAQAVIDPEFVKPVPEKEETEKPAKDTKESSEDDEDDEDDDEEGGTKNEDEDEVEEKESTEPAKEDDNEHDEL